MKTGLIAAAALAPLAVFAWNKETVQKNRYELPPASAQYLPEARAARAALEKTVTIKAICGHRGDSVNYPENTMPAFRSALDKGYNLETDLYLTLDGKVFHTHDYQLKRRCGIDKISTNVYWKGELENADAGAWKGEEFKGTKYPLLDDFLDLVKPDSFCILEIKDPRKNLILPEIARLIKKHPNVNPGNVYLQSPDPAWLRQNLPGYKSIACNLPRKGWNVTDEPVPDLAQRPERFARYGFAFWSVRWDEDLITKELVADCHRRGLKVIVWTVNDADSAWIALGRGCDVICTDRPDDIWKEMHR